MGSLSVVFRQIGMHERAPLERVYIGAVAALAALAVILIGRHFGIHFAVLGFGALFLMAEMVPVRIRDATYSVSYVIGVAALVSLGPGDAAVCAAFGGAVYLLARDRHDWLPHLIFNSGQLALTASISGLTYVALRGPIGHLTPHDFRRVPWPIAICAVVHLSGNAVALVIIV